MEKNKGKNIIIVLLIIVVLCLLVFIGFILKNYNFKSNENNDVNLNEGVQSDTNEIFEDKFIRQTKVTLIDEDCIGTGSAVVASIESDGNISISQSGGAALVTPGKAKYLYNIGRIVCDSVSLYYITEDNNLYVLENPRSDVDQVATKITDEKVVEFLGDGGVVEMEDGYVHYLNVLLEDGRIHGINYLKTVK